MLDELDVLMARMLALPVAEIGPVAEMDEPARAHQGGTAPALAATLTLLDAAQDEPAYEPAAPVAVATAPPQSLYTIPAARRRRVLPQPEPEFPPLDRPAPRPEPIVSPTPAQSVLPQIEQVLGEIAAPIPQSPWLLPLLWWNEAFDRGAQRLGMIGSWLQTSRGRAVLGFTGVLCLFLTVGCLLRDWLGWTW
jgi:hypothetical protein